MGPYTSRGEHSCHRTERQSHPDGSYQEQRFPADAINKHDGRDCGENVHQAGEHVNAQSPLFSCTRCFPQNLTEIKSNVDTDELLESSQTHSHPEHRSDTSCAGNDKIRQPRTAFALEALLDLLHQAIGIATNSPEDLSCSLVFAHEDQIARRLGNCHAA